MIKMDYLIERYREKYRKLLKEEQTKDLISLMLQGYNTFEAFEIIHIANSFNCCIDVAKSMYEE